MSLSKGLCVSADLGLSQNVLCSQLTMFVTNICFCVYSLICVICSGSYTRRHYRLVTTQIKGKPNLITKKDNLSLKTSGRAKCFQHTCQLKVRGGYTVRQLFTWLTYTTKEKTIYHLPMRFLRARVLFMSFLCLCLFILSLRFLRTLVASIASSSRFIFSCTMFK